MIKELVEKCKNRKTKKSLREENLKLQGEIDELKKIPKPSIHIIERNVMRVRASMSMKYYADAREAEAIKLQIAYNLVNEVYPFIEWDFGKQNLEGREISGSIYLAVKNS